MPFSSSNTVAPGVSYGLTSRCGRVYVNAQSRATTSLTSLRKKESLSRLIFNGRRLKMLSTYCCIRRCPWLLWKWIYALMDRHYDTLSFAARSGLANEPRADLFRIRIPLKMWKIQGQVEAECRKMEGDGRDSYQSYMNFGI